MHLATRYLGLDLAHPILPGASPMVDDLDQVRRLEDAGAPAIVMHSLFEEQAVGEAVPLAEFLDESAESFSEAYAGLPSEEQFRLGPDQYLEQLERIRRAVALPVIASLNGSTLGYWLEAARWLEEAGASAIELNVYRLATDPTRSAEELECEVADMVQAVNGAVSVPVAVKLGPYYTSIAHFAGRLVEAGADGLVLFNRFYQPDLDVERLEVGSQLELSNPSDLLLRLHWIAILAGRIDADLALSGGVSAPLDVVKGLMAGATVIETVSHLLKHGPEGMLDLREGLERFMEEQGYASVEEMRGLLSLERCPDPFAYERANYVHLLQSWRSGG